MNIDLNITFSKFIALVIIVMAFVIDLYAKTGGTVFMYAVPFVNMIITGKQYLDMKTDGKKNKQFSDKTE